MAKIITADSFAGQSFIHVAYGYNGNTSKNNVYFQGQTTSNSGGHWYPYGHITAPIDCTLTKVVIKNVSYSSYITPSSGNATLSLTKNSSSTTASHDYSNQISYTGAQNVVLEWTPNLDLDAGDFFLTFIEHTVAFRYYNIVWHFQAR